MLNTKNIKYGLQDVSIIPAPFSTIDSRSEINVLSENGMLSLFTAPMSSVVDLNNYKLFEENKINAIIPRTVDIETRKQLCTETWCAFSLVEFDNLFGFDEIKDNKVRKVLIDTAHGGIQSLHRSIRLAKELFGDKLIIMAGNIANPETYVELSEAGCDYVRCSVGTGGACLTSSNTGVYYPIASLIADCYEKSLNLKKPAKIVADGGIKGFSDAIKAMALGADYVMCGSVFNKMLESAGETTYKPFTENTPGFQYLGKTFEIVDQYSERILNDFKDCKEFHKTFYGMSTKRAQKEMGNAIIKTSEGIERTQIVEYTMSQWTENFTDYLKSAMSYCNCINLYEFIGKPQMILISNNAYNSINK